MRTFCRCPDAETNIMIGSPIDPCYVLELEETKEVIQVHYKCATDEIKARYGCPCDCHRQVDEEGKALMSSCTFCPIKHEEADNAV